MYEKKQESGLVKIIPFIGTLAIYGQYPSFLHPESPLGMPVESSYSGCWLEGRQAIFLALTNSAGSTPHYKPLRCDSMSHCLVVEFLGKLGD